MNNINDMHYQTAYKASFSEASQAWSQVIAEYDYTIPSNWFDLAANTANFLAFKNHFKITIECLYKHGNNIKECWADGDTYYTLPTDPGETMDAFIDNSGKSWVRAEGYIFVDTNGLKSPNRFGKDRFLFIMGAKLSFLVKDYPTADPVICKFGGCYFYSWLK